MKVTESIRESSYLAPFDTIILTSKKAKSAIDLTLKATGKNCKMISDAVTKIDVDLKGAKTTLEPIAQMIPALQIVADFLGSIKMTPDGVVVTGKAKLKLDLDTSK